MRMGSLLKKLKHWFTPDKTSRTWISHQLKDNHYPLAIMFQNSIGNSNKILALGKNYTAKTITNIKNRFCKDTLNSWIMTKSSAEFTPLVHRIYKTQHIEIIGLQMNEFWLLTIVTIIWVERGVKVGKNKLAIVNSLSWHPLTHYCNILVPQWVEITLSRCWPNPFN